MKKKYSCIVCDLDETLLDATRNIPEINRKAIQKAHEKGVKFVPASGRNYASIDRFLKELDLYDLADEYVLSLNGAVITENKNHRVLKITAIPFEKVKELIQFGIDAHVCIQLYTDTLAYVYDFDDKERQVFIEEKINFIEVENHDIEFLKDKTILKVIFESPDNAYLHSLEPQMEKISGSLNISYSSFRYMEINSKEIDKGIGTEELAKILHISTDEILAIGDNFNDEAMLIKAGLAACPKNAVEEIKNICDYVSSKNCSEGAVADILEKFIL